ncbi:MAG: helix-turn-helix transcriptional regulator [Subdoligranulum sp.]|jgi:YesN/AraC family two-component response regulator
MPPQRVREACHLLLERPGENMIPQETLEQTFKEIEKAPTAEALEQLLCLILQERMGLSKIALSKFKKEVQAVIIYVNAHYMDKLTLDGIADYVGLNREYLSRLFSKETGTGLFQYINEVRMKRAGEMIRSNKQVYIKEVAAAVGFDDPYFFSRKFKDFYGKTPSEYAEA